MMNRSARTVISTVGVIMGLAGLEHGIGEVLQGNIAPKGIVIESWPDSPFFEIMGGEPAMTLIPNLLVTGILAIAISLVIIAWVTRFIDHRYGAPVLIALSILLLPVGGGFAPPVLGLILGAAAGGINAPLNWWRDHLPAELLRWLADLWQALFIACVVVWLTLLPGLNILASFVDLTGPNPVPILSFSALLFLVLAILTGYAHDIQERADRRSPAVAGSQS